MERKIEEKKFPDDLEGRLNALTSAVNTSLKTVTLLHLDDSPVEAEEIRNRVRESAGKGYLPSRKSFESYGNTLHDIALVAKETITVSEVRKKNWFERYRWFFTSDGLLAIGGRDVSSNSSVIRKHMDKDDKIFHADIFGSPFFILKNCADAPMASLQEVAYATVCFSRAWREAMYGMNAYWVNPDQVKKAAPSGQFLPKGSFIIDGQRNFVKISTLKLAIGILKHDENFIVSCGPPDPIKKTSICYAIVEPADMEISAVAKKIKLEFMKMKEEIAKPISIDEFVRCLPAGTSHITDVGFGDASNE